MQLSSVAPPLACCVRTGSTLATAVKEMRYQQRSSSSGRSFKAPWRSRTWKRWRNSCIKSRVERGEAQVSWTTSSVQIVVTSATEPIELEQIFSIPRAIRSNLNKLFYLSIRDILNSKEYWKHSSSDLRLAQKITHNPLPPPPRRNSLLDQRLEVHVELLDESLSDVEHHAVDVGATLLGVRLLQHGGVVQLRAERSER